MLAWEELKDFTCQKGIFSFCHDEFVHSDQPIKTAHEFHVVENDHKPSAILGGPEVELQLKTVGASVTARLQDSLKHTWSQIHCHI